MTITEPARHRLYDNLEGLLGVDDAATLMAHLPPVGWADVATTADLEQLHDRIQVDLADIRIEIAGVRTEMIEFRSELQRDMAQFKAELRQEMADFRDQMHRDRLAAQRQLFFVVIAAVLGLLCTLAITA